MASRSRPRRGGGGARRGPPRGMPRRPYRRPPQTSTFQEVSSLGKEEVVCESKTLYIECNSNEQGKFIKVSEGDSRSRLIMNLECANILKSRLNDFLKESDNVKGKSVEREGGTERLLSGEPFDQGRRRFFTDIRCNDRGVFVKLSMNSLGSKSYVAFPLENLEDFYKKFCNLLDENYSPRDDDNSPTPAATSNNLPNSREVRAGGKSFYFDVDKNDRGVFVRLTEVVRNYGRRTHINIPNSCWPQMSEVFSQLGQELPYEEGSNSGSEDN